ncbi:MAG: TetR/AcrR family transcriptional regulator [Paracoccaceae bacterium]
MAEKTDAKSARARRASWKQNPEAVKANILQIAREVFSKHGLSGARVDEIAARTETSKRMIYYYFGDKEGLYRQTLEEAYRAVRSKEEELDLEGLRPVTALRRLIEFTFDHHRQNPDFIRLVMIENIHNGFHLERSDAIRELNRGAISQLERVIERGREASVFKVGTDPLIVHWQISAMSFFNVSNRPTFSKIFGDRLNDEAGQVALKEQVVQSILGSVLMNPEQAPDAE